MLQFQEKINYSITIPTVCPGVMPFQHSSLVIPNCAIPVPFKLGILAVTLPDTRWGYEVSVRIAWQAVSTSDWIK